VNITRRTIGPWIPAVFCAILSFMALFGSIAFEGRVWEPAFFSFLPMCFFFVGATISEMRRDIRELTKQVSELREKRVS